jgi:hypothetical protein
MYLFEALFVFMLSQVYAAYCPMLSNSMKFWLDSKFKKECDHKVEKPFR